MTKQYISRNGQIEYEIDEAGEILTYGRDALGNVVAGYDKNTNAVFTIDYKPFGEFAATTGTITGRRFLWVGTWGYRFTPGIPVSHYIRARHLMMRMGMWTSVDPLWPREVGYAYVKGMLMRKIDPFGMQPEPIPPGHIKCPPGQKPVYSGPPEGRMDPAFWHCVGVPSTPPPTQLQNFLAEYGDCQHTLWSAFLCYKMAPACLGCVNDAAQEPDKWSKNLEVGRDSPVSYSLSAAVINALRHCVWSCEAVRKCGCTCAASANLKEIHDRYNPRRRHSPATRADSECDLVNNRVGRIASDILPSDTCKSACAQMLNRGLLCLAG